MIDDLQAISNRRFHHGSIIYDFHHREIDPAFLDNPTIRKLNRYIEMIQNEDFPVALFNNPSIPRASRMRIANLEHVQKTYLQHYLFEAHLVERITPDQTPIPSYVQDVFRSYKEIAPATKPNHEPVLKNILLRDKRSVAIELPIWRVTGLKKDSLTGHIDLLQVEKQDEGRYEIKILDYKPEGEDKFLFALPQIALYGFMMREKLSPDEHCDLSCYIFDKKIVWKFKPDILQQLDDKLAHYNVPRHWMTFLSN
jgi:hypothetical protein